ncbi:MAG: DNA-formamidopyrimidine glycosylase [Bacilli bacterium]
MWIDIIKVELRGCNMPELPEVETVRQMLLASLPRTPITNIQIYYSKIIQNVSEIQFRSRLIGQSLIDIDRRGKYLIFIFNDVILISHLRMEGKYRFEEHLEATRHDHIVFSWEQGMLAYNDTRKFGTMHLFSREENVWIQPPLSRVGPEPFDDGMSVAYLKSRFEGRLRPIKSSLLDQTIISGLGNIYVDEVLFRVRIHPEKPTSLVSEKEIATIIEVSRAVLGEAIACGGTTIRTFSSGSIHGRFQQKLLIHGKKVCPICGVPIQKIVVGGRGTYCCKNCQYIDKIPSL